MSVTSIQFHPTGGDNMIGQVVTCARKECNNEFVKTTHNQKYCSGECCRIVTNRKIMENYHKDAAIRRGTRKRACEVCETPLSRYNPTDFCGSCQTKKREEHNGEAASLVASVLWL